MRWSNLKLRHRLMLMFTGFSLLVTVLFSLYALAFAYTVEDQFFEAMLNQEVTRQQAVIARTGQWAVTHDASFSVVASPLVFVQEIRTQFAAHPNRREFSGGDGRHYHLAPLTSDPNGAWLVAEVENKLVFRQMRAKVFKILLVSTLLVVALALLLAWWLAGTTAKPLSELSNIVAGLQPGQLPGVLPNLQRQDEVGVLARGLGDLVSRVQQFIEREQAFTRDASHELRTPLSVVRCAAEQIDAMPDVPGRAKAQLQLIQSSTEKLQQTVVALLSIAREETQVISAVRVLPLIEQIIIEQSPWLEHNAIRLHLDVAGNCQVTAPQSVLHIVLSNLLSNALQHGLAGSIVKVFVSDARLCITNKHTQTEAQIAPGALPASNSGHGFGLTIVRRLATRFALDVNIQHQDTSTLASVALDRT
jgi:signal transduction histidine kinase